MAHTPDVSTRSAERQATGITGLDDIVNGGLPKNRLYLVKGLPGVGKTTLALQFLMAGARAGERTLYITLSETEEEIRQVADSHGFSLDGIELFELSSAEQNLQLQDENTLYATADVDLKEVTRVLLDQVERVKPDRVVFDSLSEIRLLAGTPIRYRRQLLALKQHFAGLASTVLLLDDRSYEAGDLQVESLVHGVVALEHHASEYGADRRRLRIVKLRGSRFRSGYHDFIVRTGGLEVFPRLVAAEHRTDVVAAPISSGNSSLDAILGGGIDRATCTLLIGPAGAGKSIIATQFAAASAKRGEPACIFLFEERIGTWRTRAMNLGVPVDELMQNGLLRIQQVDPAELAPDEFTHLVRAAVENGGARLVAIDSVTGYYTAMPEARSLTLQIHELLAYLSERDVASMLTMAQSGMIGANMTSAVDISYLADTVLLLRYFESEGHVKKAVSVLKKRSGPHEEAIREVRFGSHGVEIGPPLSMMHGVLTGLPRTIAHGGDGPLSGQP